MNKFIIACMVAVLVASGCHTNNSLAVPEEIQFTNPREVTITGYSGDAMEPFISRDGSILFFNNLNQPALPDGRINDTNIYFATRVDESTFKFAGPVKGANTDETSTQNELEAVPSMDKNNIFYFINTIDYLNSDSPNYLRSIFRGKFEQDSLSSLECLPNLKTNRPAGQPPKIGELNFGAEIHCDGNILYFVQGIFSDKPFPDQADIGIAIKNNEGQFTVDPNSDFILQAVNTAALEYAPSTSTDLKELYFTRMDGSDFGIYVATRSSASEPWSQGARISAIQGNMTEAPSISYDGHLLYYHQKINDVFKIFVVERKE